MKGHPDHFRPTLLGTFAVLVWSVSMPMSRYISTQIGVPALIGSVFGLTGLLGLGAQITGRQPAPERQVFSNPYFYARWFFFVLQLPCIWTAMKIVQANNIPLVILINYLWPTAIIIFSILFAGVTISRRVIFTAGTALVVFALAVEIIQPDMRLDSLFTRPLDCLAYLLALTAALSWGAYSALSRRGGMASGGASVIPLFQLTLGLAIIPSFLPSLSQWQHLTWHLAMIIMIWSFLMFCAFQVWDVGMRRGNVVILSLCADFIPWLSLTLSHLMLGIAIGGKTMLSAALLVAGAIIARYGTLPLKVREDAPPGE